MDSSIWQSDQQVRRREFSITVVASYLFRAPSPFPSSSFSSTTTTATLCVSRRDVNDTERSAMLLIDGEISGVFSEDAHTNRAGGKWNVNATNRCDDGIFPSPEMTRAPTELVRIVLCLWDWIFFDTSQSAVAHRRERRLIC